VHPLRIERDSGQELRMRDLQIRVGLSDSIARGGEIEVVLPGLQDQLIELRSAERAPPICSGPLRRWGLIRVVPRIRLREGRTLITRSGTACAERDCGYAGEKCAPASGR